MHFVNRVYFINAAASRVDQKYAIEPGHCLSYHFNNNLAKHGRAHLREPQGDG